MKPNNNAEHPGGTGIPSATVRALLERTTLPLAARLVYVYLASCGGDPPVSLRDMADRLGMARNTLRTALKALETAGHVEVARDPEDPRASPRFVLAGGTTAAPAHSPGNGATPPPCPHDDIIALWAEVVPELPQPVPARWRDSKRDPRRSNLARLWHEGLTTVRRDGNGTWFDDTASGLSWFRRYFGLVKASDWHMGRCARPGRHASWQCTLAYVVKPEQVTRLLERAIGPPTSTRG